jgi:hypothetical protein
MTPFWAAANPARNKQPAIATHQTLRIRDFIDPFPRPQSDQFLDPTDAAIVTAPLPRNGEELCIFFPNLDA